MAWHWVGNSIGLIGNQSGIEPKTVEDLLRFQGDEKGVGLGSEAAKGNQSKRNVLNFAFQIFSEISGRTVELNQNYNDSESEEVWVKTEESADSVPLELLSKKPPPL